MSEAKEPGELGELQSADINYDDALRVLSTSRPRRLLACLNAEGARVDLEDVATDVAAGEFDCDPSEISEETEQEILVSLYHTTAPKLADAGLVEFDSDELAIEITEAGTQLEGQSWPSAIEQPA